jgi:hypothetical protein
MNTTFTATSVAVLLFGAVWFGMRIRRILPEHHLSADSKDTVKLAMGLIATAAALLLGLLVSSAKSSYDTTRSEVFQLAAKLAFLDRVLAIYGPETAELRKELRAVHKEGVRKLWSGQTGGLARLAANTSAANAAYVHIQSLSPKDDIQRSLKAQAASIAIEVAQLYTLLVAQSVPSISKPLLIVLTAWLVVIFISFSLVAAPNATATVSLTVAALSVSGAIFLILELDQPLGGLIQISSEPLSKAISEAAK